jgi:hypothetical protein
LGADLGQQLVPARGLVGVNHGEETVGSVTVTVNRGAPFRLGSIRRHESHGKGSREDRQRV